MSYQATVVNVMIASPEDVSAERQAIQTIIHAWNSLYADDRKTVLMPVTWETHSTPEMGGRAQTIINRQVLEKCDLLVAVFWTRLGSPTGESPSGTVEEIRKHLAAGKPAMIYFSEKPVELGSVDLTQYAALKNFRVECEQSGLIATYSTLQELADKFSRHLAQIVRDRFAGPTVGEEIDSAASVPATPRLSDEAKHMLVAAAEGGGDVLRIPMLAGLMIQAGGQPIGNMGERRDEARWDAAIRELVDLGLLEARGYKNEMFIVTHSGYAAADILKASQ
jgi:hypothetical protein